MPLNNAYQLGYCAEVTSVLGTDVLIPVSGGIVVKEKSKQLDIPLGGLRN